MVECEAAPSSLSASKIGIPDHIWMISGLVEMALTNPHILPATGRHVGPFRVIDGDKK
jgi:hypothetical protein